MPGAPPLDRTAMNPSPDPLDPLLDRWRHTEAETPSLAPEVWRRIGVEERKKGALASFWEDLDMWLSRPPFAALFVACCALLGLFLAEVRVNRHERQQSALLAKSYLQLIDPLLKEDVVAKTP